MAHTATDLRLIAAAGGGMILDASVFNPKDLQAIAAAAQSGGGQVTLLNVSNIDIRDLRAIAAAGRGRVVFDFSK